jgi:hypothetical protein
VARHLLELRLAGLHNRLLAVRGNPNRAMPLVIGIMLVVFVPSVRNASLLSGFTLRASSIWAIAPSGSRRAASALA